VLLPSKYGTRDMLRTSLAIAFTVALCANAVAAPTPARLQMRTASLTKQVKVKSFTEVEKLIMDRASAWDWGGGGADGAGAN
jgi:hypothetical protein